jgi:hypothetical protein
MNSLKIVVGFITIVSFCKCTTDKSSQPPLYLQATALVDITDRRDVLPDAEMLLSFYDFTKDNSRRAYFRITTTSDKLLNPVSENYLASGKETEKDNQFDDPDYRERLVLAFYDEVRKSVSEFNAKLKQDSLLDHSECFRSIASELMRMDENKADKSLLAVYSDLCENSGLFSVYTKTGFTQLQNNPASIIQRFESANLLPKNLKGFIVMFIFQPKTRNEDSLFNAMAGVYKKMLEARGAKVIIRSDNPKYIEL